MNPEKKYKFDTQLTDQDLADIERSLPFSAGIKSVEEATPESLKMLGQTAVDIATVAPQEYSFELADNIVEELFGKEAADKYRKRVAEARESSPMGTTTMSLLSTSPVSKLKTSVALAKKLPTVSKYLNKMPGFVEDAATYAGYQLATDQDITEAGVLSSMASGAGIRKFGSLFSDYKKSRAAQLNLGDLSKFQKKARNISRKRGEYVDVEDYTREMIDRYEKDYNFFAHGKVKIDPENIRFIPLTEPSGGVLSKAVKRSIEAPSAKELLSRNVVGSDIIADRLNKKLETYRKGQINMNLDDDQLTMGMFETPGKLTINREQFDELSAEMFADIVEKMESIDPKVNNEILETVNMVKDKLFGKQDKTGGKAADLVDLNNTKRQIYDLLKGEYEKLTTSTPKKEALKRMAFLLRNIIDDLSGDPEIAKMNKFLEDMNTSQEGLLKKLSGQFATKGSTGIVPYGSPEYRSAYFLETQKEKIADPLAQFASQVGRDPVLKETLKGMSSAALPRILREDTDLTSDPIFQGNPEEIPQVPFKREVKNPDLRSQLMDNLPKKLIETRLPRTTEGLIQNKQLVLAKAAQQMPDQFSIVKTLFENEADINAALPMLIEMMPQFFEKDRYNRIDNIVPDNMRPLVMEEIRKDDSLSPTQKITKLDLMNRTGEYYS